MPSAPVDTSKRGPPPVACAGQTISSVIVLAQPPYPAKLPGDLEIIRNLTRRLHVVTKDAVIRRYLLLSVGDPCDEVRRAESERIMRAQPFLVDARITVQEDPAGGVRLLIATRDEFSLTVEPNVALGGPLFRGLKAGESNLAGGGVYGAVQWANGGAYRDKIGARLEHYQFLGGRNILRAFSTRAPQGYDYGLEMVRPYLTDLQHLAWRGKIGGTETYEGLISREFEGGAIKVDREFQDIGAVGRIGGVGNLKLIGASLSRELVTIDNKPVLLTRDGFRNADSLSVPGNYRNFDVTRLNALIGIRQLRFARVAGFDALTGVQDLRVGIQTGMLFGRSVQWLGARDKDLFILGDIYAGYGNKSSFLGFQTLTEARRDRAANKWDGVLTSGRLAWYLKPADKQLTLTELLWSTGTSVRVPYQLSFRDPEGGMHGYLNSRTPGAHRVVLRTEERIRIPSRYTVADFGAAMFLEAGKLWAEDVPFSVGSPVRGSVGLSIIAAVPPKSRRTWRLDFAMPVGGDPDARFEIRFSNADRTRVFWQDPADMRRARERAVPTGIFAWP
ncbi:MAG: hypothetical protein ABJB74_22835 [Gemmatimonas sp.]